MKEKITGWATIRENASVCMNGIWTTWPPKHKYLKMACKVESPIRQRTRMKLSMDGIQILAWFHDLKIVDKVLIFD